MATESTAERPLPSDRIHNSILQTLGIALLEEELCERLLRLDRTADLQEHLLTIRSTIEATSVELRTLMVELRARGA